MKNLVKAELIKIFKSTALKIIFVLMWVLAFVTALSSRSFLDSSAAEEFEIVFNGYDAFFIAIRDNQILAAIGFIVISILICSDFENRTIQAEIIAGYCRGKIVLSKIISVFIAYLLVYLPYPLGRAIFQSIFIEFGRNFTFFIFIQMILVFFVVLLIGMALNAIVILLAFKIRKSLVVMALGFVIVLLGSSVIFSFGVSNVAFGEILKYTPIGLNRALYNDNYQPIILAKAFIISCIFILFFTAITYLMFRREELQ